MRIAFKLTLLWRLLHAAHMACMLIFKAIPSADPFKATDPQSVTPDCELVIMLAAASITLTCNHECSLQAEKAQRASRGFIAVLGDWPPFTWLAAASQGDAAASARSQARHEADKAKDKADGLVGRAESSLKDAVHKWADLQACLCLASNTLLLPADCKAILCRLAPSSYLGTVSAPMSSHRPAGRRDVVSWFSGSAGQTRHCICLPVNVQKSLPSFGCSKAIDGICLIRYFDDWSVYVSSLNVLCSAFSDEQLCVQVSSMPAIVQS